MRFDNRSRVSTYISAWMPTGDETRQSVAGYIAGGRNDAGTARATVDKLLFSNETRSSLGTGLDSAVQQAGSFANSSVAGYVVGGYSGTYLSRINKFTFPADTASTLSATLTVALRYNQGSFSNSGVAGYSVGGAGASYTDAIDRIAFPADTKTVLAAVLTDTSAEASGCSNYGAAGYVFGGYNTAATVTSRIDKLSFPAETKSTLSATLTGASLAHQTFSNQNTSAYICGGFASNFSTYLTRIDKVAYSTDALSTGGSTLSIGTALGAGFADSNNAGYVCGGNDSTGDTISAIKKIAVSTDTHSTIAATVSTDCDRSTGFANEGSF